MDLSEIPSSRRRVSEHHNEAEDSFIVMRIGGVRGRQLFFLHSFEKGSLGCHLMKLLEERSKTPMCRAE